MSGFESRVQLINQITNNMNKFIALILIGFATTSCKKTEVITPSAH